MERQTHEEQKVRQQTRMRTIYGYVMGLLWAAMGGYLLLNGQQLAVVSGYDTVMVRFLGGMFLAYGIFRAWRGYSGGRSNQG